MSLNEIIDTGSEKISQEILIDHQYHEKIVSRKNSIENIDNCQLKDDVSYLNKELKFDKKASNECFLPNQNSGNSEINEDDEIDNSNLILKNKHKHVERKKYVTGKE